MPLSDIWHPCSCFSNNVLSFPWESFSRFRFAIRYDNGLGFSSRDCFRVCCIVKTSKLGGPQRWRCPLMINAISTFETPVINGHENVMPMDNGSVPPSTFESELPLSCENSEVVDDKEKLRRMRISKANKGNTPWNKGRKHTPETIQRIKEKTRLAMRDPKVKMKLVTLGHAQSEETKVKIGVGVRLGWERRREKMLLQETCLYEWQNHIAGAARKGLLGEEELQWNSFQILNEQLQLEWIESVEQRKSTRRPKGNKRAPKSAEQKRRISEAIAAKWADSEYRFRVCSGLAKYHGTPAEIETRVRRKPNANVRIRTKKKEATTIVVQKHKTNSQVENNIVGPKRRKAPSYSDPQASDKLEMLKSIKAQRAAATHKGSEALSKARILIAEAEKAAKALELDAKKSPLAYSSLMESRKLIAEAVEVIETIENEETVTSHSYQGTKDLELLFKNGKVNGVESTAAPLGSIMETDGLGFKDVVSFLDLVNGETSSSSWADGEEGENHENKKHCNGFLSHSVALELEGTSVSLNGSAVTETPKKLAKKWVRGRLVEVEEKL